MTLVIPRIVTWLFVMLIVNSVAFDPCVLALESGQTARTDAESPKAPAGTPADTPAEAPTEATAGEADAPDSLVSPQEAPQRAGEEAVTAPSRPSDHLILTGQGMTKSSDTPVPKKAPVYKRWWFWTLAASAVAAAVVLGAAGAEESRRDLPDFPNPPER